MLTYGDNNTYDSRHPHWLDILCIWNLTALIQFLALIQFFKYINHTIITTSNKMFNVKYENVYRMSNQKGYDQDG